MLDGAYNGRYVHIKTDLDNKMACGSDSYPNTKYKTMLILNNYRVSKQVMQDTPVKEEVAFSQTRSNTKTNKTNNKVEYNCFHCGDPNQWA